EAVAPTACGDELIGARRAPQLHVEAADEVDREAEDVVLDELAAPVLARGEERAEPGVGEERVDARVELRCDEAHVARPGASVTAQRRTTSPSAARASTRQRQKWRRRRSIRAANRIGPARSSVHGTTSRYSAMTARFESPPVARPTTRPADCAAPSRTRGQGHAPSSIERERSVVPSKP